MGRISPGPTRWPPGAERRLVPAKSNLKPQTPRAVGTGVRVRGPALSPWPVFPVFLRGGQPGFRGPRVRCEGRLQSGAPPPPTVRPLGGLSGSVIHSCCGRGCASVGARRCPLGLHALWGLRSAGVVGAVPRGMARHRCKGRLVSGAVPFPVARPLGGPSGSATHMLWALVCGCGGPALSPRPACPVEAACRGGGRGPPPGGVACHRCEGRLVSDAVPPPVARPLGRVAGVTRPVCPRCGRCGRGDPAPAPQRAPLRAGVARSGDGRRTSPGGAFHCCEGRLMSGAPPPVTARPLGGLLGSTTHVLWARACGWGAQRCPLGLHALWGLLAAGVAGGRPQGG